MLPPTVSIVELNVPVSKLKIYFFGVSSYFPVDSCRLDSIVRAVFPNIVVVTAVVILTSAKAIVYFSTSSDT